MLWEGLCNSCPECRKTVDAVQAGIKPPFHFSQPSLGETVCLSFLRELFRRRKGEILFHSISKNSLPIPDTNDIFLPHCKRAVSSVVEHMLHTHGVTGSKPVPRTIFLNTPEFNISGCFYIQDSQQIMFNWLNSPFCFMMIVLSSIPHKDSMVQATFPHLLNAAFQFKFKTGNIEPSQGNPVQAGTANSTFGRSQFEYVAWFGIRQIRIHDIRFRSEVEN